MSPLKINLLLNLHVCAHPFDNMPMRQVHAPAMKAAFTDFERHGMLAPGVTHASVVAEPIKREGDFAVPRLSAKGVALVAALCAVEPPAPARVFPFPFPKGEP